MSKQQAGRVSLRSNYTKFPNEILNRVYSENLSSRELRVVLFVIRKTLGWQKSSAILTRREISQATKIHVSHISTSLTSLSEKGFLQIKAGQKGIQISLELDRAKSQAPRKEYSLDQDQVVKPDTPVKTGEGVAKPDEGRVIQNGLVQSPVNPPPEPKSTSLKESIKENTLYPKGISEYLDSLQSKEKNWREKASFKKLLSSGFEAKEIEEALRLLQSQGIPGRCGVKPHSPMRWLEFGIDSLILTARKNLKIRESKSVQTIQTQRQTAKFENSNLDETQYEQAFKQFQTIYPQEFDQRKAREQIIFDYNIELSKKIPGFKFSNELSFKQGLIQWASQIQENQAVA